ncbi:hypothetical protein K492DRAFT_124109 [Lichtheimia hyalospora FSU 10163]|nr:hypothetical protein K492DRAFT_124109 [Lichtheimia hyalospora FSU 10163]
MHLVSHTWIQYANQCEIPIPGDCLPRSCANKGCCSGDCSGWCKDCGIPHNC